MIIFQVHLPLDVTVLELKTLRIRSHERLYFYIRSIDINEAKTAKFRKTPPERVIQNLKLLLLQCIYFFPFIYLFIFLFWVLTSS